MGSLHPGAGPERRPLPWPDDGVHSRVICSVPRGVLAFLGCGSQGVLVGAAAGGSRGRAAGSSRGGGEWVVPVGFRWLGPGAPGSFGPMGLLPGARAYLPYAPASSPSGSANLLGRCVNPHPAFHHRVSSAPGFSHPRLLAGIQRRQAQAVRRCSGDPGESSEALPRPVPAPSDHSRYPRRPWESSLHRNSKTNVCKACAKFGRVSK